MDGFDAFDAPPAEVDPAAEFLAQEQVISLLVVGSLE